MCVPSNLAELNPPSPSHFNEPRGFVAQMAGSERWKKCRRCYAIVPAVGFVERSKQCRGCQRDMDAFYQASRRATDPAFALTCRARMQATQAFRGAHNSPGFFRHMPYTKEEFASHLLSTLPEGYTEVDACDGNKLHIDHIRPVSSFNLTGDVDDEFLACWALDNLQLLPAAENLAKRDSLNWGKR